jgi:hypothetical protein
MNVSPELLSGALVAVVGGGGLWAYLGGKGRNKVDLVTIAQDAAKSVIDSLRDELDRQRHHSAGQDKRIEELEAQDERCRAELADLRRRIG